MLNLNFYLYIAKNPKKLSECTLAFGFIEGKALKFFPKSSIEKDFFLKLEKNVKAMHSKNIVHLDLRNLGNILVGKDGHPYIIDFQSAISTKYLGSWLSKIQTFLNLLNSVKILDLFSSKGSVHLLFQHL